MSSRSGNSEDGVREMDADGPSPDREGPSASSIEEPGHHDPPPIRIDDPPRPPSRLFDNPSRKT